uniref:1-phosphofructokinase family hexose kinase n=1 Tax=Dictyoglomus thermophilum TaxID=14 RepID=A0A7C3MKA3_DICTH
MILIVNLNPSLDVIFYTEKFLKNKVNRSIREYIMPGGKGINVAKTLKIFNEKLKVIGFCGGNTGIILKQELKKRDIDFNFVEVQNNTRFAIGIKNLYKKELTILNGAGSEIPDYKIEEFFKIYRIIIKDADTLIVSGSIPPNIPYDIYFKIFKEAERINIIRVLDAKGKEFIEALKAQPDIIKPNKEEMEDILNKTIKSKRDIIRAFKFIEKFQIKYPIISLGKKGAVISIDSKLYHSFLPPIDGIHWGAGDAFLAGFIYGLRKTNDPLYSLKIACATGYVKVKKEELNMNDKEEILKYVDRVSVKEIK